MSGHNQRLGELAAPLVPGPAGLEGGAAGEDNTRGAAAEPHNEREEAEVGEPPPPGAPGEAEPGPRTPASETARRPSPQPAPPACGNRYCAARTCPGRGSASRTGSA